MHGAAVCVGETERDGVCVGVVDELLVGVGDFDGVGDTEVVFVGESVGEGV